MPESSPAPIHKWPMRPVRRSRRLKATLRSSPCGRFYERLNPQRVKNGQDHCERASSMRWGLVGMLKRCRWWWLWPMTPIRRWRRRRCAPLDTLSTCGRSHGSVPGPSGWECPCLRCLANRSCGQRKRKRWLATAMRRVPSTNCWPVPGSLWVCGKLDSSANSISWRPPRCNTLACF